MTDFSVLMEELDADVRHFDEIYPSLNQNGQLQYYDQATFNSVFPINSVSDLSISHVNLQSINAKGDRLTAYLPLLKLKFDMGKKK